MRNFILSRIIYIIPRFQIITNLQSSMIFLFSKIGNSNKQNLPNRYRFERERRNVTFSLLIRTRHFEIDR